MLTVNSFKKILGHHDPKAMLTLEFSGWDYAMNYTNQPETKPLFCNRIITPPGGPKRKIQQKINRFYTQLGSNPARGPPRSGSGMVKNWKKTRLDSSTSHSRRL